jgi:hypothetical protein
MSSRFVGGLNLSPRMNFTQPLVELNATRDTLSFRLRFGPGLFVGPWIVSRKEVARIRATDSDFSMVRGVELYLLDGRCWRFWTMKPGAVLNCLEQLDWPVHYR